MRVHGSTGKCSTTDTPRIERLKELFELALTKPSGERDAFVRDASSGDEGLETELSSLLEAHDASSGFFEKLAEDLIVPVLLSVDLDDQDDAAVIDKAVLHYELVERIGGGGMGVVYKALDTRLGRTVALKFLPRRHAANPAARARLLAEARSASSLDHPNIGVVYEIAESEDGRQFIAMGWYDGETLKEKIRRGPLAVPEAASIASQLASALAAAHRAGIVHRDVKPANVIITPSGTAKLVDFGIAKLMSDDIDEAHAAGTIAYMSPEQTRNTAVDVRTDIWSTGVLMFEMLTGVRPFKGATDEQTVAAIRDDEPSSLSSFGTSIPRPLAAIVERCLRKDPALRYFTAEDLASALSEAAGSVASTGRFDATESISAEDSDAVSTDPITIAVLPFEESIEGDDAEYLGVGLADDLRTTLLRFKRVSVPSYLSSYAYRLTEMPVVNAAKELAANFVITGSVGGTASEPVVELQLTDGESGRALWSQTFDGKHTPLARIVREASESILESAGIALTGAEKNDFARGSTSSARAYDFHLRGRHAELTGTPRHIFAAVPVENMRTAQAFYAQARALDPGFAANRAKLALTHIFSATMYDATRARLDQARIEAESSLRLDPHLSDAREALSAYWLRSESKENAIEVLETGLRDQPNNVRLLFALGTQYISAGRWEDGLALFERAMRLDPRNPTVNVYAAVSYSRLRRNEKAFPAFDRAIEVFPDDYVLQVIKGQSYLRWSGTVDVLDATLQRIPSEWDANGMATYGRYTVLRVRRLYQDALKILDQTPTQLSRDAEILYHPKSLMRAEMHKALGNDGDARAQFEIAVAFLVDSLSAHPDNPGIHSALGLAYAGLGRKSDAIAHAERAMEIAPVSANSLTATAHMGRSIEIFAQIGEHDRAIQIIELLLSMPAGREVTVPFLQVWPGFDPLRDDPRFEQLIERFSVR